MNFLFVGFSDQNANVLTFFIQKQHPKVKCTVVPRAFAKDLRLILPTLTKEHKMADAYIINLDGVGMTSYTAGAYKGALLDFVGNKPIVLLSRGDISQWQAADILPGQTLYQKIPYSQDEIGRLMRGLLVMIEHVAKSQSTSTQAVPFKEAAYHQTAQTMPAAQVAPAAMVRTPDPAPNLDSTAATTAATDEPDLTKHAPLEYVMRRYFADVYQNSLLRDLVAVFLNTEPFRLVAGTQEIFIHPKRNIAMGRNVGRFLDYCAVAGSSRVSLHSISIETITESKFEVLESRLTSADYRRYSLNTLLWQVYSAILPEHVEIADHSLKLKVRFMPNFGRMSNVPEYVHAVVATCLVAPRSVEELQEMFPDFAHAKNQLQRILAVAILSGAVDMDVIMASVQTQEIIIKRQESNEVIAQAAKAGFFKRLLHKLTTPI
ncbi:MAG: hypothetical protein Q4G13_03080 [Moraxella sp.]|nr:hypothetical protein [Moraxella sp.]